MACGTIRDALGMEVIRMAKLEQAHQEHIFKPIYNNDSRILILGTFPSVKSRENQFYYGHPQNRFWKVLAAIFESEPLTTIEEKKAFLLQHRIAIWDVIASCDITGSSDSSIRNVMPTDLRVILKEADIAAIYANGATAAKLFHKYQESIIQRNIICLPSTSPANAGYSLERLIGSWKVCKDFCS